jgi:Plasmid encoded RepA protein
VTATPSNKSVDIDFRGGKMPDWVMEVVNTHLAIEAEDARSSGNLGFMARALVQATMPYRDPKTDVFQRQNGDFKLRIVAGYEGGIPYGIYPRLLMSWVTTEAVKTQSPEIQLGDSLNHFLRDVLDLRSSSGGKRGSSTRVSEQMKRLFGSMISAQYVGGLGGRGFVLRNVLIAESADFDEKDLARMDAQEPAPSPGVGDGTGDDKLWVPQQVNEAGAWSSKLRLTNSFFQECVNNPVPIDLRAYKVLRGSAMAMDIYTWLTYRLSYTTKMSRTIRWEALQMQFGSSSPNDEQGLRDFRKAFLKALKVVLEVYPQARLKIEATGVVLLPSRPHVLPAPRQTGLF